MTLHFETALLKQTALDQQLLNQKINDWRLAGVDQNQVVNNLYLEHFAPMPFMDGLIKSMLAHIGLSTTEFKDKVFEAYKKYTLSGGPANLANGIQLLGFVLTRYTLIDTLKQEYFGKFKFNEALILQFVNDKANGFYRSLHDEDKYSIKGKDSIVWITWSKKGGDPFEFVDPGNSNQKEEIYNALALSEYYKSGPIFLFYIDLNILLSGGNLLKATVFDAGNYPPFRPPDQSVKEHGYTYPHDYDQCKARGTAPRHEKRPEAIVQGDKLDLGLTQRL